MILGVLRCFQLGCNFYRIAPCAMHNHPLCAHFVELPLCSGEYLAGLGCLCWKSNWTKFDHVGSTGGHWETISGSFSIPFGSGLKVQSQCAPIIPSPCSTIYEEDKFYSSLMIVIFSLFSNSHCLS